MQWSIHLVGSWRTDATIPTAVPYHDLPHGFGNHVNGRMFDSLTAKQHINLHHQSSYHWTGQVK